MNDKETLSPFILNFFKFIVKNNIFSFKSKEFSITLFIGALSPLVICLGTFNYRDNCAFFYLQNQKIGQMKSK
ncbi:TPA: hypothetical protein ACK01R_002093, partial [Staphylococcus aureus]